MNKKSFSLNVDLLKGPIFKSLILFSIPLLISFVFQQLYNTVDTMIVGYALGDTSLAAIGSCGAIFELLVGFGQGLGNGMSMVVARSFGSGDTERLKRAVAGTVGIGLAITAAVTLAAEFCLRPLLLVLDTPPEILEEAFHYIITIGRFSLVLFAYNLCSGLLRAIGNSVMPLVFLILSSVLNVLLDLWFITGLRMGVQGAAVATVLAQGVSVVLCLLYIAFRCPLLVPERRHLKLDGPLYRELAGQGLSMGFMSCIVSAGSVILQLGINGLGTSIIAAHTAARKLFGFTAMPVQCMAMAVSTFVSQNRGAGQGARIRKAMRCNNWYALLSTMVICAVCIPLAGKMVALISGSSDPVVLQNGARYIQLNSLFYVVLGILVGTRMSLQGLGAKLLPLISSGIELVGKVLFVLVFIPRFAYMAVILCEPVIWCLMALELVVTFYRNPFIRSYRGVPAKEG
ncbi:MAG: MATE family efflux transporter [Oscillospiraceae bacterium]|nr:MATE family efflux transporter [Oscillospiraceae bacterium]